MSIPMLTITGYNVRSLNSGKEYVNELLTKVNTDILFISEHRLYSNELHKLGSINEGYEVFVKQVVIWIPHHKPQNLVTVELPYSGKNH